MKEVLGFVVAAAVDVFRVYQNVVKHASPHVEDAVDPASKIVALQYLHTSGL